MSELIRIIGRNREFTIKNREEIGMLKTNREKSGWLNINREEIGVYIRNLINTFSNCIWTFYYLCLSIYTWDIICNKPSKPHSTFQSIIFLIKQTRLKSHHGYVFVLPEVKEHCQYKRIYHVYAFSALYWISQSQNDRLQ